MNFYSEIVLFAVVLATNLVLLGMILAAGLTLAFRFIENVSPRLRCCIAIAVFALAIILPVTVTLKTSPSHEILAGSATSQNYAQESVNSIESSNFAPGGNAVNTLSASAKNTFFSPLEKFISVAAGSLFGKVFFGFWIMGIAWLLFWEALGMRRLRRTRKFWEPATEAERAALLCPKNILLYFDEWQSPGTVGLLYSAIVLPKRFSAGVVTDEKLFIVRHELAHAQRRDPLVSFILRLLRALFWISPALWLLERLIDSEREGAADRAAIGFSPREPEFETSALNYADALLNVVKELNSCGQSRREPQMIGIGTRSELEIRIRRFLSASRTTRRHVASACAAGVLSLVLMIIFPGAGFSEQLKVLQSEFIAATAERKTFQPDKGRIEPSVANRQDKTAQLPARVGDRKTPRQVRAAKTKVNEEAAGFLTKPAEILSGKTAESSESDENRPARPLQSFENTAQVGQTIYGPARNPESGVLSPPPTSTSNDYSDQPARRKRDGENQFRPVNNQMPATAPR